LKDWSAGKDAGAPSMAWRDRVMKLSERKFVVHEGLTEMEQMKLEMFRTVVRSSVRVLLVTGSAILVLLCVRALAGALGYRL